MRPAPLLAALFGASLLAACGGSRAPMIAAPLRIEGHCPQAMEPRESALSSILTSTDDKILAMHPTEVGIRREIKALTGAIAYWNAQPLVLPRSSKELGESDGFARVDELAVSAPPAGATSRVAYLRVRDHGEPRWIAMTAYDVQNVCIAERSGTNL